MQDNQLQNVVQATMQPFVKLVQANMALLTKFSIPPEMSVTANAAGPIQMMQQSQESMTRMLQSPPVLQLMQGLAKNYAEFMSDFSESSLAMLSHSQETMVKQTREASSKMAEATQAGVRHVRSATG